MNKEGSKHISIDKSALYTGTDGFDPAFFYSVILITLYKYNRQEETFLCVEENNGPVYRVAAEIDDSTDFTTIYNSVCENMTTHGKDDDGSAATESVFCIRESNEGIDIDLYGLFGDKYPYMKEHIEQISHQCTGNKEITVGELNTITSKEEDLILNIFNDTYLEYDKELFIDGILRENAEKYKDKKAVVFEDQYLTYGELYDRANQVACVLRASGVEKNDFVGLIFERGISMITGILGTIFAGAAYVPIDPTYPDERIAYILNDCDPKVILTNYDYRTEGRKVINIDEEDDEDLSSDQTGTVIEASDLAYCIYTSGTSGNPKGVLVEHGNLLHMIHANIHLFELTSNDTVVQVANYIFDQSVSDFFITLSAGATLCIASFNTICTPNLFAKYCNDNEATIIPMTPSLVAQLDEDQFKSIRILDCGGEAANVDVFKRWRRHCKVVNSYGPTEATVNASGYYYEGEDRSSIPIGKPIRNTHIYIIQNERLCGIGVLGELCVTGNGVARGYLNRPDLNCEKFVDNPFGQGKMYKTGDMARWLPDGNIEYLGRIDGQVKVHGFRIELGDIENAIRRLEGIKNCAVISKKYSGEQRISAYLVSDEKIDVKKIRDELKNLIPGYMIPSYIMQIDRIPVTRSGKLDSKMLPEPDLEQFFYESYTAPRSELESEICDLFKEVLGISNIGVTDDFFYCGGDSIKAIQIINRIGKRYGIYIDITGFFKARTVEKICALMSGSGASVFSSIPVAEKKNEYEMSSVQKRLYLIWKLDRANLAYNLPELIHIKGEVDIEKLDNAFKSMIRTHKILRTDFKEDGNGNLIQHISESVDASVEYEKSDEEENILTERFIRPFDLENAPLVRIKLIKRNDGYMMLIDKHHIISDGISDDIFINQLFRIYNGEEAEDPRVQYCDYSEWFKGKDLSSQKNYWLSVLDGEIPVLNMPEDYKRDPDNISQGDIVKEVLPSELMRKIGKFTSQNDITENMLFLSAIFVLLAKYSRQDDIIIGIPLGNRMHIDTEEMLGMFVNTALIRGRTDKKKSFLNFLSEIKEQCLNTYANQDYPFEELVNDLNYERIEGRNPFFDVMFAMQNYDREELKINNAQARYGEIPNMKAAMFDLTFNGEYTPTGFEMSLAYSTGLYTRNSAEKILRHLKEIISEVIDDPEKTIGEISIISEEEKDEIINRFNNTRCDFEDSITINKCFEKQVELFPDNTAVIYEDRKLTYDELNKESNRLANRLREAGIGSEDFVALLTGRSCEMIVGILAVLKAGAAFVPIDPEYPEERINYILEDISPKAVLVYDADIVTDILTIDLADRSNYAYDSNDLDEISRHDNLAYCIYTSGTTGKPKGVLVEHTGVLNLRQYFIDQHHLSSRDNVLKFANYVFDATISELCMSLLTGASMHIVSEDVIGDSYAFQNYIEDHNISVAIIPPVYLAQIDPKGLRTIISAGSEVTPDLVEKCSGIPVFSNDYGPTEITVCATYWKYTREGSVPHRVPIGKPINNKKVYIMQDENLVGIGIPGELCVGGTGVARGYHNMPELTKEKFIEDPFGEGRLYRTGDLARWLPDGNIEYLGRIDGQIKIRGFRVELSEIESVLRESGLVKDCAVIVRERNAIDRTICAYYISDDEIDVKDIREELGKKLPEYMIPGYFMRISEIPVTRNGKLDKSALPEIITCDRGNRLEPQNEVEELLFEIFKEILCVDNLSTDDSFFVLGGDSIKAIRIASKMREKGYLLQVKDVISKATIVRISGCVKKIENTSDEGVNISGTVADTPIISMFKRWGLAKPQHFNQDIILEVKKTSKEDVFKAIDKLMKHHDMLRATLKNGEVVIADADKTDAYVDEIIISDNDDPDEVIRDKCDTIQRSFDLDKGPLIKAVLFKTLKTDLLYICCHHLVIDNVSWKILLSDLHMIFDQIENGKPIMLPPKTASYKAWAEALKEYSGTEQFRIEKEYWMNLSADAKETFTKNKNRGSSIVKNARISLDPTVTGALLTKANKAFYTEINDLLLASLGMSLFRAAGNHRNIVFLEGHGRETLHKEIDIDRTIGWFTTVYPVILDCGNDIRSSIINTKEMLHRIPNHGLGYGLCDEKISSDQTITFNYLGEIDSENRELFPNADLDTGCCVAPENETGDIEINGYVRQGEMVFEITYSDRYDCETIEKWTEDLRNCLIEVSRFCTCQNRGEHTPSDFVYKDISNGCLEEINETAEKNDLEIDNILPLTPLQQGMWLRGIASDDKTAYIIQNVFRLKGDVDPVIVKKSLHLLMLRYEVLRSSILTVDMQPVMVIWKSREIELYAGEVETEEDVEIRASNEIKRGFDFAKDPLLRVQLLKADEHDFYMIWSIHHIIVDGWSLPVLLGRFVQYYNELSGGISYKNSITGVEIEQRRTADFTDYIEWKSSLNIKIGLDYWRGLLKDYNGTAAFIQESGITDLQSERNTAEEKISLPEKLRSDLAGLSETEQVTLNTIVEAAFGVLLQKDCCMDDVVFGKVVSGRNAQIDGINDMAGLFINTIPVRVRCDTETTVKGLLGLVQNQSLESSEYDYCALSEIQKQSAKGSGLVNTVVAFENYYVSKDNSEMKMKDIDLEQISSRDKNEFSLSFFTNVEENGEISFEIIYDPGKYAKQKIRKILEQMLSVLGIFVEDTGMKIIKIHKLIRSGDESESAISQTGSVRLRPMKIARRKR